MNAAYQPRRALRAVGCMRLFGDRFGSTRRFISPSEMVRPAANSARERAMSSRNSGGLTQGERFAINVPQWDDCCYRPVAFRQDDGFVAKIGDVVRKWTNRRGQPQSLHSRISLPPIISTLRRFRPTARMRTAPLSVPTTS